MAIISAVLGGIGGFLAFLCALMFYEVAVLQAFGFYLASSFVLTTSMIALAMTSDRW